MVTKYAPRSFLTGLQNYLIQIEKIKSYLCEYASYLKLNNSSFPEYIFLIMKINKIKNWSPKQIAIFMRFSKRFPQIRIYYLCGLCEPKEGKYSH